MRSKRDESLRLLADYSADLAEIDKGFSLKTMQVELSDKLKRRETHYRADRRGGTGTGGNRPILPG